MSAERIVDVEAGLVSLIDKDKCKAAAKRVLAGDEKATITDVAKALGQTVGKDYKPSSDLVDAFELAQLEAKQEAKAAAAKAKDAG